MENTGNKKPQNPSAFPSLELDYQESSIQGQTVYQGQEFGMSLRDYFAAKAIPQILLSWRNYNGPFDFESQQGDCENIARNCYLLADEMLKQREL